MEIYYIPSLFWSIMRMLLFVSYLIPFASSALQLHPHLSNVSDEHALLEFKSAITYDTSQSLPWKRNISFCRWKGVACSRSRQRVVSLDVSSMGLQGTVSPFLGNLSFLRILNLRNNSFHGHIPDQLGYLFRLKMLLLSQNRLHGSIPPTLSGCRSLHKFLVGYNNLTGNIPVELGVLPKLENISLTHNNLTGTIPASLGNISSLKWMDLCNNNLHGNVPSELGTLRQLSWLYLCENHLTGQIPSSLSNCTNLQVLFVSFNQLTGHIPGELCRKNTILTGLYLSANQLSGTIPASIFNCTKLRKIDFAQNQLNGIVPMELAKLSQLELFNLGVNQLVSSSTTNLLILTALTNCSSLEEIDLENNHLTGRLPFSIGHLSTKMNYLNLGFNALSGEIPPQIGNLTSLTVIALHNNLFTGEIHESSLNMLLELEELYVSSNNLQGNIPTGIGQLKRLGTLDLGGNNLSGIIPDSVASLQQLRYLNLAQNQLSGNIPANLGKCLYLLQLDISHNRFSGRIPPEVAGLPNLAIYFNLSNNFLHGSVPSEISKMTMVQAIDISANQLSGYLPSALQRCKGLGYLNLSYNAFEGLIPDSLSELQSLLVMDFSFNNLSGRIPMSLENLKMLQHLNFSFNKLSGAVPKGGVFKNLGATAFMGNLGLCGPWVNLSPCLAHKQKGVLNLKRVLIPVVTVAVILVLCLILGIFWKQNRKRHILTEIGVMYRRISHGELVTATDGFSDTNLLGVGNFGKVYKGVLNDGTIIAAKLLNLENEGAHKSFDKECKVLSRVRHRNLIKIITSYSDLQMKALIFPLMPNGSLEKWLYPDSEEESGLMSLIQRLNIALDIAQGMAYLHHYCFVQVIHCDLKPNNVLLGEDMTAYLIDFGIATICFANSEDPMFISTHALKGSIGYIPPEYGIGGRVTSKGDVYSYGILLLEMLTRKKPTHNMFVEGMNLQKWVGSSFPNCIEEVVDMSLLSNSTIAERDKKLNCLSQLVSMGLLCTKESPERRPTMIDIVSQLQRVKDTFLEATGVPKFQSNITNLLGSTSTTHDNHESQSSSTS